MALTDTAIRNAKPRETRFKLSDEKGLYLSIETSGSKLWRLKYRFAGKEKKLALGACPELSLAKARELQLEARRLLTNGIDPSEHRKRSKRAGKIAAANTFEAVGREWYEKHASGWAESHSSRVLGRLENDLFPWLGSRPIAEIEADELLGAIRRTEARGALDSAHRCLGYCSQIFRYAIATARAKRNPAADLRGALPPVQGNHFASITDPEGVAELLRAIDGYQGNFVTRCALRFQPLTFVRPFNLRTAEWTHFDLEKAEWRIPAEVMKMREDLIVPLSRQAVRVLSELRPLTGNGRFVFPGMATEAARCPRTPSTALFDVWVTAEMNSQDTDSGPWPGRSWTKCWNTASIGSRCNSRTR